METNQFYSREKIDRIIFISSFRSLVGHITDNMADIYIAYDRQKKELHLRYYFYNTPDDIDNDCIKSTIYEMLLRCKLILDDVTFDFFIGDTPPGKQEALAASIFGRRLYE